MEPMDKRAAIKDASDFMFKSQGYVDLILLKKSCPFPEFYLKEVLVQEGFAQSAAYPTQYVRKMLDLTDAIGPVRVDLVLECFGPKLPTDPSLGKSCVVCDKAFKQGDYTTLLGLGPGADVQMQKLAADGKAFKPVVKEAHWACVLGRVLEDTDA